jgi:hypothetical protein
MLKLLRYALALAKAATHKAVLFVALALIGGTPVKIKTGNVIKLPPPATALSPPAINAVINRSKEWNIIKDKWLYGFSQ